MNIDRTIERLEELKASAKTEAVKMNVQMKIDILLKKKRQYDDND